MHNQVKAVDAVLSHTEQILGSQDFWSPLLNGYLMFSGADQLLAETCWAKTMSLTAEQLLTLMIVNLLTSFVVP